MAEDLDQIIDDLGLYANDPLGFVYWSFPWGEEGGPLAEFKGPEEWQTQILLQLKQGLLTPDKAILLAVTSGHGIGKSALVAWIILWAISTFPDTRGVVTANTETQLKTKTWVELATWFRRFIARDLFKLTATALFSTDKERDKTWRIDMTPWSEKNTEAFAGLHNQRKRILVVYDEASAIEDVIWEVTEGALTDKDTEIIWVCFSNPTKNSGRFRECHPGGMFAHRWKTMAVDSRTVTFTNKEKLAEWGRDYGEDSDFFRVRVKGEFPRVDADSFISRDLAQAAVERPVEPQTEAPIIIGVDVGRFGDDPSVIYPRQGRDGLKYPPKLIYKSDLMFLAAEVANVFNSLNASIVMVDSGGVGGGVVDRLRQLRIPVVEVDFSSKPDATNEIESGIKYANKRAEIWGAVRDWLGTGSIPSLTMTTTTGKVVSLVDELAGPMYGLNSREAILLESKKDMRSRGVPSPNIADALACTFAYPHFVPKQGHIPKSDVTIAPLYDPYSRERIYGNANT